MEQTGNLRIYAALTALIEDAWSRNVQYREIPLVSHEAFRDGENLEKLSTTRRSTYQWLTWYVITRRKLKKLWLRPLSLMK